MYNYARDPYGINGTQIQNDIYTVKLKLEHHIPEYLPIRGKKAKIYYHGMLSFCSACHVLGHLTVDCENQPASWWDYIERLKSCDVPIDYFGSWIVDSSNPLTSTPKNKPDELKAQFLSFFKEFVLNSSNPEQSDSNPSTSSASKSRFDALYVATPKLKEQIANSASQRAKAFKNLAKQKSQNKRGGKNNTQETEEVKSSQGKSARGGGSRGASRGDRGGNRGGYRGGRGDRGGRGGRGRGSTTA